MVATPASTVRRSTMPPAFICDALRTPFGRYGGALSSVRTDDLGAVPIAALMARHPNVDWAALDDVLYGCANQAGEDNRNVARMAALLAGLPQDVPGATLNRLCGSGLDAVGTAARAIKAGGNYGDIFNRNVGADSPLKLPRGLNAQWNKGGILYALPLR